MKRNQQEYLQEWKQKPNRKPLVLRGARQVGKSYLVRAFGQSEFENTLEINFELEPDIADLIIGQAPERALRLLEAKFGVEVTPGKTLLFLDEIQARGDLLVALRYLYEKAPDLHVIAAGSLLDFVLNEKESDVGVRFNADFPSLLKTDAPGFRGGRIDYSLLSLPHYLVGQVGRMVGELLK